MPAVKPFRGLRYVPTRVELSAVLATDSRDPRRVRALLDDEQQADDGIDGPLRRAKLRLAEWRRAGIVKADDAPCLYALRRRDGDGNEFVGVFCALGVDAGVEAAPDAAREARLEKLGVAVEPVVAAFTEPRVKRALENAIDRDPDATWKMGDDGYELWSIDDDSTTARIGTLLSQASLAVQANGEAWGAHAAWWKKKSASFGASVRDDDRVRAAAFALAFLHSADEAWPVVPTGIAMAPLQSGARFIMTKNIVWCTHPRHLPKPPKDRTVVLDVAFAAGSQWKSKTKVFLDALGDNLVRYIDHHEHKEGWAHYANDPRFILVPNKIAHACPELVTPERVRDAGAVDTVVAHADFDGCIAAVKWWREGREPWPGADEDARAIDSPGRGHALTPTGARISYALEEASARMKPKDETAFLTRIATALIEGGSSDPVLDDEIDQLAKAARDEETKTRALAMKNGKIEAPGVFVVRVDDKPDNRVRRNLLVAAEEHASVGAIFEPDPQGGHWLIAATFDEALDLEEVEGFAGGRSDYRFARAHGDGSDLIRALSDYVHRVKHGS